MKHLEFEETPLSHINNTPFNGALGGIKIKRDDLFFKAGGGSKARMLQYILATIKPEDCDVVVTAGGPCSNFNRACALQCAQLGLKMHLICYTEHPDEFLLSENFFICKLANIKITYCKKSEVRITIEKVMYDYKSQGINAVNIYGGGRCLEGIFSYYDAVGELNSQLGGKMPKEIFVTCGTGTTTSGLLAGLQDLSPETKLHAISIARNAETEVPIIEENLDIIGKYLDKQYNINNLHFHEEFIMGEYGSCNTDLINFIEEFISSTGILVDPIYTGKTLFGMYKVMNNPQDSLFWHTGAIYTLLSNQNQFLKYDRQVP